MKKVSRAYHHGDLRAAMIQAALTLVRQKGPRNFTLNEASRLAKVSKSAPYNHFKDKDALLVELIMIGNGMLEAELREAAAQGATAKSKLESVYLAYIRFAHLHPELFAVMFQSGIDKEHYPELKASAAAAFSVGLDLAKEMRPSVAESNDLALVVWTMAHGFASLRAENAFSSVFKGPMPDAEPTILFAHIA